MRGSVPSKQLPPAEARNQNLSTNSWSEFVACCWSVFKANLRRGIYAMTDDQRILSACRDEELLSLCSAMCDGTIDETGRARLDALSEADPANRLFCAVYFRMNGQLMRIFR